MLYQAFNPAPHQNIVGREGEKQTYCNTYGWIYQAFIPAPHQYINGRGEKQTHCANTYARSSVNQI
jgi:hypothetical protein